MLKREEYKYREILQNIVRVKYNFHHITEDASARLKIQFLN